MRRRASFDERKNLRASNNIMDWLYDAVLTFFQLSHRIFFLTQAVQKGALLKKLNRTELKLLLVLLATGQL